MDHAIRMPTILSQTAAAALLALSVLAGCASPFAARGPIVVETGLRTGYVSDCVYGLFNTRDPLVRRSPALGGAIITAVDLRGGPIAAVAVTDMPEGSRVTFVSDHADRWLYENLFRTCVPVPPGQ